MTSQGRVGVQRCIGEAIKNSGIDASQVDLVSDHLTATAADKMEIDNWSETLNRWNRDFPYINSLKDMIGDCLNAAGSILSVTALLQLYHGFIHPNINCEDPNPEITSIISSSCIPQRMIEHIARIILKANFGFGDVNVCLVYSKFSV